MIYIEIAFASKDDNNRPSLLGGIFKDELHSWTEEQVIIAIEHKILSFYTKAKGKTAPVEVRSVGTKKYLVTIADGTKDNNLGTLPDFPSLNVSETYDRR